MVLRRLPADYFRYDGTDGVSTVSFTAHFRRLLAVSLAHVRKRREDDRSLSTEQRDGVPFARRTQAEKQVVAVWCVFIWRRHLTGKNVVTH